MTTGSIMTSGTTDYWDWLTEWALRTVSLVFWLERPDGGLQAMFMPEAAYRWKDEQAIQPGTQDGGAGDRSGPWRH